MQHPFAGITREEFLGKVRITTAANAADLLPSEITSLANVTAEPFLDGRYRAKFCQSGAVVLDGETPIASYNFGDTLVVARKYRRQGIAAELVYQWRMRYPMPAKADVRTRAAQAVQKKVWERITLEVLAQQAVSLRSQADNDDKRTVYHATTAQYDVPDPRKTIDGGLHLGTLEQALMRAGKSGRRIYAAQLLGKRLLRQVDSGGDWASAIRQAKAAGHDGIVYLNRYEGLTTEDIERLSAEELDRLDSLSDEDFLRLVPTAQDSYIIFSTNNVRWVGVLRDAQDDATARSPRQRISP